MKQVVIFIAPPGAGKGTQANVLTETMDFYHLESSKVIEQKFEEADKNDIEIQKEKHNWRTGILVDPRKVVEWIVERIKQLHQEGRSIVFSGSPRTLLEAQEEMPLLEELYGKDFIKVFHITLSEGESIKRNSERRICDKERHPIPDLPKYKNITACPWDGSEVVRRELDKPAIIRERLVEYENRTEPVLHYIKEHGYSVIQINGEDTIENVSAQIAVHFND
jgi:adenylate kinase